MAPLFSAKKTAIKSTTLPHKTTLDAIMLTMVDMVLANSTAGLIDLNLNQEQELIGGGCFPYVLKDYSMHGFYGTPKQGQSLEDVKELLLSQIEEVKKGNFKTSLIGSSRIQSHSLFFFAYSISGCILLCFQVCFSASDKELYKFKSL